MTNPTTQWCMITISGSLTQLSECGHLMFWPLTILRTSSRSQAFPCFQSGLLTIQPPLPYNTIQCYLPQSGLSHANGQYTTIPTIMIFIATCILVCILKHVHLLKPHLQAHFLFPHAGKSLGMRLYLLVLPCLDN